MAIEPDELNPDEVPPSVGEQFRDNSLDEESIGHCPICGEFVVLDTDGSGHLVLADPDSARAHRHQQVRLQTAELQVRDPSDGSWRALGMVEGPNFEESARQSGYAWALAPTVSYRFAPVEREPQPPEDPWVAYYRMFPVGHPYDDDLSFSAQLRGVEQSIRGLGTLIRSFIEVETRTGRRELETALAWCGFYDARLVIATLSLDLADDPEFRRMLKGSKVHILVADDPDWFLDYGLALTNI